MDIWSSLVFKVLNSNFRGTGSSPTNSFIGRVFHHGNFNQEFSQRDRIEQNAYVIYI